MATAQDILKICASQVGIKESPSNSNNVKYNTWFYGHKVYGSNYSWCSVFLDWCFEKAGAGKLFPHNANAAYSQDEMVAKCGGKWIMKKNTSSAARKAALKKYKPGDIVCFDFGAYDAWRDHIGIIRSVNVSNGTVQCYEGNTSKSGSQSNGGMVCLKTRKYSDICSCARPAYSAAKQTATKTNTTTTKTTKTVTKKINRKAVDISAWQGNVSVSDWKKVQAAGYDTVILRSSYTSQSSFSMAKDKVFEHNIKTASQAGMKIGVYHYSQATTKKEAASEANMTIKTIAPFKKYITEPVVFDWEFGKRLNSVVAFKRGKTGCTNICKAFCDAVKKAGYDPMVYANYSTFNGYLNVTTLKKLYKLWLAHYASATPFTGMYMWQYSSSGRVNGLPGRIDVNKMYSTKTVTVTIVDGAYTGALPNSTIYIRHGSATDIKRWQNFLNWFYDIDLDVDGEFGPNTRKWTIKFQDENGLEVDGIVGEQTIDKAKSITKK